MAELFFDFFTKKEVNPWINSFISPYLNEAGISLQLIEPLSRPEIVR